MVLAASLLTASLMAQENAPPPVPPDGAAEAPRFRFGAFGNIAFEHVTETGHNAFGGAELDLYATARLSESWSALAEGFIQHAGRIGDIDLQPTKKVELEIERIYLEYGPSDRLRLAMGQMHTGIIHWNESEHRGRFLQTPIDVPAIAVREEQGGAWPLHFVGAWASGRPSGPLGLQFGVAYGEARGKNRDEIQPALDKESSPALLVSMSVSPDALPGWQLGGAEYDGEIPAPNEKMREVDRTFFTSYLRSGIELRTEWAEMHHRRFSDGARFVTHGWYLLASLRPHGRWVRLRPYLLLDHLNVPGNEAFLSEVHDQRAWAAGMRWDANAHLAIKADYRAQIAKDHTRERLFRLQFAVSF
ncbi:MAG: hypothetical protein JWN02_836 [Acidobacteria bacterium]|nr:hypothetical protein [Acidobacteriota bacterium]